MPQDNSQKLDQIILLAVTLQGRVAVEKACVDKLRLSAEEARGLTEEAYSRILDAASVDRKHQAGVAMLRLNHLYREALAQKDVKTALGVQKEINRLLHLGLAEESPQDTPDKSADENAATLDGLQIIE